MNLVQNTQNGEGGKPPGCATQFKMESQEEDTAREKDGSEQSEAAHEGAWGWVIVAACFVNYVLLACYFKSLSLFYVALLEKYRASSAKTALLFSIRDGVFSIGSLFIMNAVVGRLGIRKTAVIGALFMSLGGILSSLVDEMLPLISILGTFFGLGHAMLIAPGEVLLGSWFHRRRALALALAKCGSSVGNMLMPPLLTLLLHHYGLSGALLLTGALALHCLPAAILFRPPQDRQAAGGKARAYSAHSHPGLAQDTQCMIQDGDSADVGLMSSERSNGRDRPSAHRQAGGKARAHSGHCHPGLADGFEATQSLIQSTEDNEEELLQSEESAEGEDMESEHSQDVSKIHARGQQRQRRSGEVLESTQCLNQRREDIKEELIQAELSAEEEKDLEHKGTANSIHSHSLHSHGGLGEGLETTQSLTQTSKRAEVDLLNPGHSAERQTSGNHHSNRFSNTPQEDTEGDERSDDEELTQSLTDSSEDAEEELAKPQQGVGKQTAQAVNSLSPITFTATPTLSQQCQTTRQLVYGKEAGATPSKILNNDKEKLCALAAVEKSSGEQDLTAISNSCQSLEVSACGGQVVCEATTILNGSQEAVLTSSPSLAESSDSDRSLHVCKNVGNGRLDSVLGTIFDVAQQSHKSETIHDCVQSTNAGCTICVGNKNTGKAEGASPCERTSTNSEISIGHISVCKTDDRTETLHIESDGVEKTTQKHLDQDIYADIVHEVVHPNLYSKEETVQETVHPNLYAKEETLIAKEEKLYGKEETLYANEETPHAKEQTFSAKEEALHTKEETLDDKGETLHSKEDTPYTKEETLYAKEDTLHAKQDTVHDSLLPENTAQDLIAEETALPCWRRQRRLAGCARAAFHVLDFSLFASPMFRLLLAFFLLFPCINTMVVYIPALANERGLTDSQAALLLTIIGGLDVLCRPCCAFIANSKKVKVSTMIVASFVILGVTSQCVRFMTSWVSLVTLSVLLGLLAGVGNVLLPVLVVEFVGLSRMAKALGFVMLVCAAAAAAIFPLLGLVRDATGSYVAVYHVIGSGGLVAAGLLCCEHWVRRLETG